MPVSTNHKTYQRTVLLIFGMHRSGTSAFAGLLKESGISMGNQLMEPAFDNPKGFFEDKRIVAFNEQILHILGQSWQNITAMPTNWLTIEQIQALQTEASHFIQTEFADLPLFALKDPRFSLTFPFWQQIFQKLEIEIIRYILVRHPYEVARSLFKRNQMPKTVATALWMKYMFGAIEAYEAGNTQLISFEAIVHQPQAILNSLNSLIKVNLKESTTIAKSFIQQTLRHHHNTQLIGEAILKESYTLFQQLIEKPNQVTLTKLKHLRQSNEFKQWIPVTNLVASLAIDFGNGFTELAPLKQAINLDTKKLVFNLTNLSELVPVRFRLSLANQLVALELGAICLGIPDNQLIQIENFTPSDLIQEGQNYVFGRDGYIEFYPLLNGPKIETIIVRLVYQKIGTWAETAIAEMHKVYQKKRPTTFGINDNGVKMVAAKQERDNKSTFWMAFLKTGLSNPVAFLRNINLENFNTLRKALLNEPPTLILSNLKKKLFNTSAENKHNSTIIPSIAVNESDQIHSDIRGVLKDPLTRLVKQKKWGSVLYFSTYLPDFDTSSGGKRATRYLSLLAENMEVLVYSLGKQEAKYVEKLAKAGIQVLPQIAYSKLKTEIPFLKTIICSTYTPFSEAALLAKQYPNAQLVIDTVDVHWVRESRSIDVIDGYSKEQVIVNKTKEIEAYRQADYIWAVTEEDKRAILAEIPTAKINLISNVHSPIVQTYADNGKHTLLFIGSYKHEPNIAAAQLLASTIFPQVKAVIQDAELIIAGANAPKAIVDLGQLSGVTFKGFVEEKDMAALYEATFLSVSPLLAGAGIKGKICEAIAYATPVVTTPIGNEGINLIHEKEGLIAATEDLDMVIIDALQRNYDFVGMTQRARQKLDQLVGPLAIKQRLSTAFFPEVSICIVTWNGLDLLKKCLATIEKNTHYPNYKILVYSNACSDGTVDFLKETAKLNTKLTPIFSATNEVFVKPNNKMMRFFPENEVVLLNNDTEVTECWLLELHRAAYASKKIGIAGSKILYPDGRLQEFGAELYAHGGGQNIGKGAEPQQLLYRIPKLTGYVSGCAMYIKRSTIEKIGVFDEQFHPCYYEDSDYCYTAAEHGIHTIVTPHSIIYHKEGATAGQDTGSGFKQYQILNKDKFLQKHFGKNNGIDWGNESYKSSNLTYKSFVFTHIPKCGGTSFRKFIYNAAIENGIEPSAIYIPGFNEVGNDKNLAQLSQKECFNLNQRKLKILANHSMFEAHTTMGIQLKQPFYYTLLREPISRFLSHYDFFYYQQGLNNCKGIALADLPDEKRSRLIEKLANLQLLYLTNRSVGTKVTEDLFKEACENLQNHYADFGILEDIEQSIERLKSKLPAWLKSNYPFPSLNNRKKRNVVSQIILEEISSANQWDIRLYEWAKENLT